MKLEYAPGATPLDPDEIDGLMPKHITTQDQLNEWEAANILDGQNWLFSKTTHGNFLTIDFVKLVHKKMFDATWEWAGIFRKTEKSIGVAPYFISTKLIELLADVRYQITHIIPNTETVRDQRIDEICYCFHHRLVAIHSFPNGNGRHARLITDFLLVQAGRPQFTWGDKNLGAKSALRTKYIEALKQADKRDYKALAAFVRS